MSVTMYYNGTKYDCIAEYKDGNKVSEVYRNGGHYKYGEREYVFTGPFTYSGPVQIERSASKTSTYHLHSDVIKDTASNKYIVPITVLYNWAVANDIECTSYKAGGTARPGEGPFEYTFGTVETAYTKKATGGVKDFIVNLTGTSSMPVVELECPDGEKRQAGTICEVTAKLGEHRPVSTPPFYASAQYRVEVTYYIVEVK